MNVPAINALWWQFLEIQPTQSHFDDITELINGLFRNRAITPWTWQACKRLFLNEIPKEDIKDLRKIVEEKEEQGNEEDDEKQLIIWLKELYEKIQKMLDPNLCVSV